MALVGAATATIFSAIVALYEGVVFGLLIFVITYGASLAVLIVIYLLRPTVARLYGRYVEHGDHDEAPG